MYNAYNAYVAGLGMRHSCLCTMNHKMAVLDFVLRSVIKELGILVSRPFRNFKKSQVNDNFNDTVGKSGETICSAGCSFIFMLHVN